MKLYCRKATAQPKAVFNGESKSTSPHTMCELKELGLNSCVALTKPLIGERRLQFAREYKD